MDHYIAYAISYVCDVTLARSPIGCQFAISVHPTRIFVHTAVVDGVNWISTQSTIDNTQLLLLLLIYIVTCYLITDSQILLRG